MRLSISVLAVIPIYACGLLAGAQQDATSVLAQLAERSKEYQRVIPNFTCKEVVTTTAKRDEKLLRRVEFQADIHVQRKADKQPEETFVVTSYMGKPTPNGGNFYLPLYMKGGLSDGMPSFFQESSQACFEYRYSSGRVDFKSHEANPKCAEVEGTTGFALMDGQNEVLHGEIQMPRELAGKKHRPALARVDYADVRLNERTFRLPTHVYGEGVHGDQTLTFDAFYTGCKLFTAKTTIRAGDGVSQPDKP